MQILSNYRTFLRQALQYNSHPLIISLVILVIFPYSIDHSCDFSFITVTFWWRSKKIGVMFCFVFQTVVTPVPSTVSVQCRCSMLFWMNQWNHLPCWIQITVWILRQRVICDKPDHGSIATSVYAVRNGVCTASAQDASCERQIIKYIRPGDWFLLVSIRSVLRVQRK